MARPADRWLAVHRAAGAAAFLAGWPRAYNPHPVGGRPRSAWTRGWWTAHDAAMAQRALRDPAASSDVPRVA
jgi:hypothetical protein